MDDSFASKDQRESTDCGNHNRTRCTKLWSSVIPIASKQFPILDQYLLSGRKHTSTDLDVVTCVNTICEIVERKAPEIHDNERQQQAQTREGVLTRELSKLERHHRLSLRYPKEAGRPKADGEEHIRSSTPLAN